jgi:hypothetical protein
LHSITLHFLNYFFLFLDHEINGGVCTGRDQVSMLLNYFSSSLTMPNNNICHGVVFSAKPSICEILQKHTQAEHCMATGCTQKYNYGHKNSKNKL